MERKGKLIVFEGIDGSGKTTQAAMLHEYLREKGYDAILTREPTDTIIGGVIRSILKGHIKMTEKVLPFLFAADRINHIEEVIKPALEEGKIVVCDRYYLSNLAYQWDGFPLEWLEELEKFVIKPDAIIILDIPPRVAIERMEKERFYFMMYEKMEKLERVRENFINLGRKLPNTYIIDGSRPKDEVFISVLSVIKELGLD